MLEYLEIENAGPADRLHLDLAPRLNLLTGDNGLGKSFLLDVAWWGLVQKWPAEVNPQLSTGHLILPKDRSKDASLTFKEASKEAVAKNFNRQSQKWALPEEYLNATKQSHLVIYSQSDGSIAIFDRSRNHQKIKDPWRPFLPSIFSGSDDFSPEIPYPYAFTPSEILSGAKFNDIQTCNGLIQDWSYWQRDRNANFLLLENIINILTKDSLDVEKIGNLVRVYVDDVRDIPSINTRYGQIPIIHVSAGMKRILYLAYLLVWTWQEHLRASELRGLPTTKEIVFLIDELDVHLHPKWQRTIVKSLMEVMAVLAPEVKVQIIAATHSPLVMASVEPFFDPAQDAWFDLDLNRETGQVEVVKRSEHWYRRGDADAWLKSEAFDQKSGYAPETEQALDEAKAAMGTPVTTREQADVIDAKLRRLLGEMDTFWVDWGYFFEEQGWTK